MLLMDGHEWKWDGARLIRSDRVEVCTPQEMQDDHGLLRIVGTKTTSFIFATSRGFNVFSDIHRETNHHDFAMALRRAAQSSEQF